MSENPSQSAAREREERDRATIRSNVEAWPCTCKTSSSCVRCGTLILMDEIARQREEIARLRAALADADAYMRRALVATVDMPDLAEAREDLYAGRNMARAALAASEEPR